MIKLRFRTRLLRNCVLDNRGIQPYSSETRRDYAERERQRRMDRSALGWAIRVHDSRDLWRQIASEALTIHHKQTSRFLGF